MRTFSFTPLGPALLTLSASSPCATNAILTDLWKGEGSPLGHVGFTCPIVSLRGRVPGNTNQRCLFFPLGPRPPWHRFLLLPIGDEQACFQLLLASSRRASVASNHRLECGGASVCEPSRQTGTLLNFSLPHHAQGSLPLQDFGLGRRVDTCNSAGMPPPPFPPRGPGKSAPPSLPSGGGACPPYPSDFVICGT